MPGQGAPLARAQVTQKSGRYTRAGAGGGGSCCHPEGPEQAKNWVDRNLVKFSTTPGRGDIEQGRAEIPVLSSTRYALVVFCKSEKISSK